MADFNSTVSDEVASIYVQAILDTAKLEKTLDGIGKKKYELGVSVDDAALYRLNKHLALKENHLKEVNKYFNSNPITPTIDTRQIEALNRQLASVSSATNTTVRVTQEIQQKITTQATSDLTNNFASIIGREFRSSLRELKDELAKKESEPTDAGKELASGANKLKEKVNENISDAFSFLAKPIKDLSTGFFEGVSHDFGKQISKGLQHKFAKELGFDFKGLGDKAGSGLLAAFGIKQKKENKLFQGISTVGGIVFTGLTKAVESHAKKKLNQAVSKGLDDVFAAVFSEQKLEVEPAETLIKKKKKKKKTNVAKQVFETLEDPWADAVTPTRTPLKIPLVIGKKAEAMGVPVEIANTENASSQTNSGLTSLERAAIQTNKELGYAINAANKITTPNNKAAKGNQTVKNAALSIVKIKKEHQKAQATVKNFIESATDLGDFDQVEAIYTDFMQRSSDARNKIDSLLKIAKEAGLKQKGFNKLSQAKSPITRSIGKSSGSITSKYKLAESKAEEEMFGTASQAAKGFAGGSNNDLFFKYGAGNALAYIKAFKQTFQIKSPSKVMELLGSAIGLGLAIGIEKQLPKIIATITRSLTNIKSLIHESIAQFDPEKSTFANVRDLASKTIKEVPKKAKEKFNIPEETTTQDLMEGVATLAKSAVQKVKPLPSSDMRYFNEVIKESVGGSAVATRQTYIDSLGKANTTIPGVLLGTAMSSIANTGLLPSSLAAPIKHLGAFYQGGTKVARIDDAELTRQAEIAAGFEISRKTKVTGQRPLSGVVGYTQDPKFTKLTHTFGGFNYDTTKDGELNLNDVYDWGKDKNHISTFHLPLGIGQQAYNAFNKFPIIPKALGFDHHPEEKDSPYVKEHSKTGHFLATLDSRERGNFGLGHGVHTNVIGGKPYIQTMRVASEKAEQLLALTDRIYEEVDGDKAKFFQHPEISDYIKVQGNSSPIKQIAQKGKELSEGIANQPQIANALGSEPVRKVSATAQELLKAGTNVSQSFASGFAANNPKVMQAVDNAFGNVINRTKQIFKIASPSKVFFEIGLKLGEGLKAGAIASITVANSAIAKEIIALTEKTSKSPFPIPPAPPSWNKAVFPAPPAPPWSVKTSKSPFPIPPAPPSWNKNDLSSIPSDKINNPWDTPEAPAFIWDLKQASATNKNFTPSAIPDYWQDKEQIPKINWTWARQNNDFKPQPDKIPPNSPNQREKLKQESAKTTSTVTDIFDQLIKTFTAATGTGKKILPLVYTAVLDSFAETKERGDATLGQFLGNAAKAGATAATGNFDVKDIPSILGSVAQGKIDGDFIAKAIPLLVPILGLKGLNLGDSIVKILNNNLAVKPGFLNDLLKSVTGVSLEQTGLVGKVFNVLGVQGGEAGKIPTTDVINNKVQKNVAGLGLDGSVEGLLGNLGGSVVDAVLNQMGVSGIKGTLIKTVINKKIQGATGKITKMLSGFAGGKLNEILGDYAKGDIGGIAGKTTNLLKSLGLDLDPKKVTIAVGLILTAVSSLHKAFNTEGFNLGKALTDGFKEAQKNWQNAGDDLKFAAKKAIGQENIGDISKNIVNRIGRNMVVPVSMFDDFFGQMGKTFKARALKGMSPGDQDGMTDNVVAFGVSVSAMFAPLTTMFAGLAPLVLPLLPILSTVGGMANMLTGQITRLAGIMQQLEPLQRKLMIVGGDEAGRDKEFNYIQSIAFEYNIPIVELADNYADFSIAARGTKLEGEGVKEVFKGISTALEALDVEGKEASSVFLALTQMMSKGTVSMQELRRQLANALPGALGIFAEAAGMTVSELEKAVVSGNILAEDVLPRVGQILERDFGAFAGGGVQTLTQALSKLGNAVFTVKTGLIAGFGGTITKGVELFAILIEQIGKSIDVIVPIIRSGLTAIAATVLVALSKIMQAKPIVAIIGNMSNALFSGAKAVGVAMAPWILSMFADIADVWLGAQNSIFANIMSGFTNMGVFVAKTIDNLGRIATGIPVFGELVGVEKVDKIGGFVSTVKDAFTRLFRIIPPGVVEFGALFLMSEQLMTLAKLGLTPVFNGLVTIFKAVDAQLKAMVAKLALTKGGFKQLFPDSLAVGAGKMLKVLGALSIKLVAVYAILGFAKGDFSNPIGDAVNRMSKGVNEGFNVIRKSIDDLEGSLDKFENTASKLKSKGLNFDPLGLTKDGLKSDDFTNRRNEAARKKSVADLPWYEKDILGFLGVGEGAAQKRLELKLEDAQAADLLYRRIQKQPPRPESATELPWYERDMLGFLGIGKGAAQKRLDLEKDVRANKGETELQRDIKDAQRLGLGDYIRETHLEISYAETDLLNAARGVESATLNIPKVLADLNLTPETVSGLVTGATKQTVSEIALLDIKLLDIGKKRSEAALIDTNEARNDVADLDESALKLKSRRDELTAALRPRMFGLAQAESEINNLIGAIDQKDKDGDFVIPLELRQRFKEDLKEPLADIAEAKRIVEENLPINILANVFTTVTTGLDNFNQASGRAATNREISSANTITSFTNSSMSQAELGQQTEFVNLSDMEFEKARLAKRLELNDQALKTLLGEIAINKNEESEKRVQELRKLVEEDRKAIANTSKNIATTSRSLRQALIDQTKTVANYYRDAVREAINIGLEFEKAQNTIKNLNVQNQFKQALIGAGDNIYTQFIDSLISGLEQISEASNKEIEAKQRQVSYQNQVEDIKQQGIELQRSLPGQIIPFDTAVVTDFTQSLKGVDASVQLINDGVKRVEKSLSEDAVQASQKLDESFKTATDSINKLTEDFQAGITKGIESTTNLTTTLTTTGNTIDTNTQKSDSWLKQLLRLDTWAYGFKGILQDIFGFFGLSLDNLTSRSGNLSAQFSRDLVTMNADGTTSVGLNTPNNQATAVSPFAERVLGGVLGNAASDKVVAGIIKQPAFKIMESVGSQIRTVRTFEDLAPHHPSVVARGGHPNRPYRTIEGRKEEVNSLNKDLIKKDFILQDSKGNQFGVPVPSPVAGYAGNVGQGWGAVNLYADKERTKLIAQVGHMIDLKVKQGDFVQYGQTLGGQAGMGRKGANTYGTHVDMSLDPANYRRYLADLQGGKFETEIPQQTPNLAQQVVGGIVNGAKTLGSNIWNAIMPRASAATPPVTTPQSTPQSAAQQTQTNTPPITRGGNDLRPDELAKLTPRGRRLYELRRNPNVLAMADAVARAEGTDFNDRSRNYGYGMMIGGEQTDDLSGHAFVEGGRGYRHNSSAFGRYQIMDFHVSRERANRQARREGRRSGTPGLASVMDFQGKDTPGTFSPGVQDLFFLHSLESRGVLDDVLKGNFNTQVFNRLAPEYASIQSGGARSAYSGQGTPQGSHGNLRSFLQQRQQIYANSGVLTNIANAGGAITPEQLQQAAAEGININLNNAATQNEIAQAQERAESTNRNIQAILEHQRRMDANRDNLDNISSSIRGLQSERRSLSSLTNLNPTAAQTFEQSQLDQISQFDDRIAKITSDIRKNQVNLDQTRGAGIEAMNALIDQTYKDQPVEVREKARQEGLTALKITEAAVTEELREQVETLDKLIKTRNEYIEITQKDFAIKEGFKTSKLELEVQRQRLSVMQQTLEQRKKIAEITPLDPRNAQIPDLERNVALVQADIDLKTELIELEERYYTSGKEMGEEMYTSQRNLIIERNERIKQTIDLNNKQSNSLDILNRKTLELERTQFLQQSKMQALQITNERLTQASRNGIVDMTTLTNELTLKTNELTEAYARQQLELEKRNDLSDPEKLRISLRQATNFTNQLENIKTENAFRVKETELTINPQARLNNQTKKEDFLNKPRFDLMQLNNDRYRNLGGNEFVANRASRELAIEQEKIRAARELMQLRIDLEAFNLANPNDAFTTQQMNDLADATQRVSEANIQKIANDYRTFGQTLNGIVSEAVKGLGSSLTELIKGTKSLNDVLDSLFDQILTGVLNTFISSALGGLFGGGGGFFGGIFAKGGKVPNFADGGVVGAMQRERRESGKQPVLIAAHVGEMLIPATRMKELESSGLDSDTLLGVNNYAKGGVVGDVQNKSRRNASGGIGRDENREIAVKVETTVINDVSYVTLDQFQQGLQQAAVKGAEGGYNKVQNKMANSPSYRRSVGL